MIVITGATGFIGSAMVWYLNTLGESEILACDSIPPSKQPEPLRALRFGRFVTKDGLLDFLQLPEAQKHVRAIVHMGACSSTTEMDVAFLTENNVEYTRTLWNWCTTHRKPFIYASSGAVYGDGSNGFDDQTPTSVFRPLNPYGESKAAFDRFVEAELAQKANTPPHWFGLRFFNVYGPNEYLKGPMASVVFKAFQQIKSGPNASLKLFRSHHPKYKDGEQLRDFVYVKDITRWMTELLGRCGVGPLAAAQAGSGSTQSGIFNMGYGEARTWLDLAKECFASIGKPVAIEFIDIPEEMRPRYQYFTQAKMDRLLGIGLSRPQWSLERGIRDYIQGHLLQEDPWLRS